MNSILEEDIKNIAVVSLLIGKNLIIKAFL